MPRRTKTAREKALAGRKQIAKMGDPLWRRIVAEEYSLASMRAEQRYRQVKEEQPKEHANALR